MRRSLLVLAAASLAACGSSKAAAPAPTVTTGAAAPTTSAAPTGPLDSAAGVRAALVAPSRGQVVTASATVGGLDATALETRFTQPHVAFAAAAVWTGGSTYAVVVERFQGTLTDSQLTEILGHDIGLAPEITISPTEAGDVQTIGGTSVTLAVVQTPQLAVVVLAHDVAIDTARSVARTELDALSKAAA